MLFYDFRKYTHSDPDANYIGIQYECMLTDIDERVDLSMSRKMSIKQFEKVCVQFYLTMKTKFLK